jgi:hypothetical protein
MAARRSWQWQESSAACRGHMWRESTTAPGGRMWQDGFLWCAASLAVCSSSVFASRTIKVFSVDLWYANACMREAKNATRANSKRGTQ